MTKNQIKKRLEKIINDINILIKSVEKKYPSTIEDEYSEEWYDYFHEDLVSTVSDLEEQLDYWFKKPKENQNE